MNWAAKVVIISELGQNYLQNAKKRIVFRNFAIWK